MLLAAIDRGREDELIWLLRHRTRRRIILAIGDAGRISATALRDSLKISTGSLYYNLRQLKGLVEQDKDRNYTLTEDGLRVYKALKERGDVSADVLRPRSQSKAATILGNIFFPLWLYTPIYESVGVRVSLPLLSFALSAVLLIYTKTYPLLLHFYNSSPNPILITLRLGLNIVILYLLITVLSIIFSGVLWSRGEGESLAERLRSQGFGALGDEIRFMLSTAVAILPLMLFPAILSLDKLFKLQLIPEPGTPAYYQVRDAFLIIAQGVSLPFLAALTAYGRRLNASTAALITLVVFFISHTIFQIIIVG